MRWLGRSLVVAVLLLAAAGCNSKAIEFDENRVSAMSLARSRSVPTDAAQADVTRWIAEAFGTPDQPKWPVEWLSDVKSQRLVSIDNLNRAAGAIRSDQDNVHSGLYQEHCVVCHGIAGGGNGPAARLQSPYPRDLRAGVFKWKSTPRADKPTRDNLRRLLVAGVPGSSMPSFDSVAEEDREALIDYLIYLSVRGQTEQELLALAVDELDYDSEPPSDELRLVSMSAEATPGREVAEMVTQTLDEIVGDWVVAQSSIVPEPGDGSRDESIDRGKAIFHGAIANCVGCHGPGGQGGMPTNDYDDWTKQFTTRIGISPEDRSSVGPMVKAGALPPRKSVPRNLVQAALRGGEDPETLYRRIQHGIAGSPMPGVEVSDAASESGTGLSPGQVWDLVHYLEAIRDES